MLICDICKKEVGTAERIILHTKAIDFCSNCKTEINEVLKLDEKIFSEEYKICREVKRKCLNFLKE